MRSFVGCVIRESLVDAAPLAGWTPVAERAVEVLEDADSTLWRVCWFQVDHPALLARLPALARAMRPHWYAHFWEGDDLCVILSGRAFWARISDRSTWREFAEYGDSVGVQRKWTENVPTTLPSWVEEAMQGKA